MQSHEVAYSLLLKVREATIAALVPGKEVREVMAAARALIEKENPALLPNFVRNCGFSVWHEQGALLCSPGLISRAGRNWISRGQVRSQ